MSEDALQTEIDFVVAVVLRAWPASSWPAKRLRMLLVPAREEALRGAYVLGVRDGAVAMQRDLAQDPRRFDEYVQALSAGRRATWPPPEVTKALNRADFATEYEMFAAINRYTMGWSLGEFALLHSRHLEPDAALDVVSRAASRLMEARREAGMY